MKHLIKQFNLPLATIDIFEALYQLIFEYNQHTNLTRIIDKKDFIERHLIDSLQLLKFLPQDTLNIIDVGTGGGFPGLPLWIARPDCSISLLDATQKKIKAMILISEKLQHQFPDHFQKLPICIHERAETIGQAPLYRESFDIVVSRAVASLPTLLELCVPLTKVNGVFIAMKGKNYQQELDLSHQACQILGANFTDLHSYQLYDHQEYVLIFFKKLKTTPANYPRRAGTPNKKPL